MQTNLEHVRNLRLKSWQLIHEASAYVVSERLRQMQELLAKYDPNQPRVPAGSSAGGQWTSVGGGGAEKLQKIVVRRDGIPVEQTNIFVGGADDEDGWFGNHPVQSSDALNKEVYGDNYYATHDQIDAINDLIRSLPEGRPITIIGHSYGGSTAAGAILANPGRVGVLVTIDPVGDDRVDYDTIQSSVGNWINVNAVRRPDSSRFALGNIVAYLGGSWDNDPQGHADTFISAPFDHPDFNSMMNHPSVNGFSAVNILNGKK